MPGVKKPRHKIELIGGPMDGQTYMAKMLPEVFELSEIIKLDPSAEVLDSDIPSFYRRERFSGERWLYLFSADYPY